MSNTDEAKVTQTYVVHYLFARFFFYYSITVIAFCLIYKHLVKDASLSVYLSFLDGPHPFVFIFGHSFVRVKHHQGIVKVIMWAKSLLCKHEDLSPDPKYIGANWV